MDGWADDLQFILFQSYQEGDNEWLYTQERVLSWIDFHLQRVSTRDREISRVTLARIFWVATHSKLTPNCLFYIW